jgi:hypothetical protein
MVNHPCLKCGEIFTKKSTFNYHINRKTSCVKNIIPIKPVIERVIKHDIVKGEFLEENVGEKKFSCEFCKMTFTRKFNLERHQVNRCKNNMTKNKIIKCKIVKEEISKEEQNKELNEIKQVINIVKTQNEELKNEIVKLTSKQNTKTKEFNKINKNLKKLETTIPNNSSQIFNNQLINKIIEKEKKIDELDNLTKEFMINNFPNNKANINIKPNNIVLVDDTLTNNKIDNKFNEIDEFDNKPMNLILNNQIIQFRESDNYINATQLCKAGGKNFGHWNTLDSTKELISVLASEIGIPISQLIDSKKGNSNNFEQGTWIHPDLAIQLSQWLSPKFAIQVSLWIRELFTKGSVSINLKILKEKENIIKEKDDMLKNCEKRIKILENITLRRQKRVIYPETNVVYIVIDKKKKKERIYIIGKTKDLTQRLSMYEKDSQYEVIYYKEFSNEKQMDLAESMVLDKLDEYREQGNRDRFILPAGENIKLFIDPIDKAFDYFN